MMHGAYALWKRRCCVVCRCVERKAWAAPVRARAGRAAWGTTAACLRAWERGATPRMHRAARRWRESSGAQLLGMARMRCGARTRRCVCARPPPPSSPPCAAPSLLLPRQRHLQRSSSFLVTPPPSRWARSPSSPRWAVLSTRRAPAATHLPLPAPRAPRAPAATARDSTHSIVQSARGARAP